MLIVRKTNQVLTSFERASRTPFRKQRNIDERFSVRLLAGLSRRLDLREIELFRESTRIREMGLTRIREGSYSLGESLLVEADKIIVEMKSNEGRIAAKSFQAPAEAYLAHMIGNHALAQGLLTTGLELCVLLRVDFDYQVEIRRLHLGRNIVRTLWNLEQYDKAWAICKQLLEYLWFQGRSWPLQTSTDVCSEKRDTVRADERAILTDQLLTELLNTSNAARESEVRFLQNSVHDESMPGIVNAVVALSHSIASDDPDLLTNFHLLFEQGHHEMATTWKKSKELFDIFFRQK